MPTVLESIAAFLDAQREHHPGPDLLARWNPNLETQVNVAADDGEPVGGRRGVWANGIYEWWNLRVPKDAKRNPHFKDYQLRWPLERHAEGIGSTGWDWQNRRSIYVGFDFDAITGHAAGVGLTPEELAEVRNAAKALPYVEVRRSTGGRGLHLYVRFDGEGIPTANHTEHAALARCVLAMMSSETGFDFARQIDCCGSVLWIWHRKLSLENQGLSLVKAAKRQLSEADLPGNWKDHVEVVSRRRAKIRVRAVSDDLWERFEALANSRRVTPLDEKHKAIIDALTRSGFSTIWVPDHHLLQTHTRALAMLMEDEEQRKALGLVGCFQTLSPGTDPGQPNCFMFPLPEGGWRVYRFSPGVQEADTWERSEENWTYCHFNQTPDLAVAARAMGGVELADNGGFMFDTAKEARRVLEALGDNLGVKGEFLDRETHLRGSKDGRLVVRIKQRPDDARPDKQWVVKRGGWWERVYNVLVDPKQNEGLGQTDFDNILRTLVSPAGERAGWVIYRSGSWDRVPKDDARSVLLALGHTKAEADMILGGSVLRAWKTVNLPFQPEYPGDRQWNLGAAQLRCLPADLRDDEVAEHPHWDMILEHCFGDLDSAIKEAAWAQRANIRTGAQYGLAWIACLLREPFEPLPYLFFFGPENSGKSILHEAIQKHLVTGGVVRADRALSSSNDFNGELANAVLAVVEETNVSASPVAHNRIKDWVTSKTLWIRKMRTDAYSQSNTLHFIQCANHQSYCPVLPGDTRITVIYVPELAPKQEIAKAVLMDHLQREAPHFMHTLANLELPPVEGRLRLPVVSTRVKAMTEDLNRDPVEAFILECCHKVPGEKMLFSEFYEKFLEWLPADERVHWYRQKVSKSLPLAYPVGAGTANKRYIGNLSWEPATDGGGNPYVLVQGKLRQLTNI